MPAGPNGELDFVTETGAAADPTPGSAFRTGRNAVEFFWVDGAEGAEELTRLEPG